MARTAARVSSPMGQPLFGVLLMYGLRTDLLDSSTVTSRPPLAKRSTHWVVINFRSADHPDRTRAVSAVGIVFSNPRHAGCTIHVRTPTRCRRAEANRLGCLSDGVSDPGLLRLLRRRACKI